MKFIFALSMAALSFQSFSSVIIQEEVYIFGNRPEIVKELITAGSVEVDHVTSEGFELYGSHGLMDYLDQKNIPYMDMKIVNKSLMADYPTHAEMTARLVAAQNLNPRVIKVFSIGKSIKGKDLLVVKISDNVNNDEVEPEFKYISSMHGDEITGREMTVALVEEIAQNYGKDRGLTELVNNTEIFIMPSMNPDGSEMRQRANARGVDLNRNFPDITKDTQTTLNGREVENQAVMKFQASRQISLSANFHGGTIVANYPWDSTYDRHPMDAFVQELSLVYAQENPEMHGSTEFKNGITNGADWYVVKGGMQDWSYFWFNDLQITLEISHTKWPRYADIPGFYKSNRDSMVEYMKQVHRGAGFRFSRPNVEGVVAVKLNGTKSMGSFAFNRSEFYKVMPEGDYTFTITEKGGAAQTVNVRVQKDLISSNGNFLSLR